MKYEPSIVFYCRLGIYFPVSFAFNSSIIQVDEVTGSFKRTDPNESNRLNGPFCPSLTKNDRIVVHSYLCARASPTDYHCCVFNHVTFITKTFDIVTRGNTVRRYIISRSIPYLFLSLSRGPLLWFRDPDNTSSHTCIVLSYNTFFPRSFRYITSRPPITVNVRFVHCCFYGRSRHVLVSNSLERAAVDRLDYFHCVSLVFLG